MKYILIILISLVFYSCSKDDKQKSNKENPEISSHSNNSASLNERPKKLLRSLITENTYKGNTHNFENLSLILPQNFKMKNTKLFFEENGTNLSIEKDYISGSIHDYIIKNYKNLKKDYSNTIKEEEELYISKHLAKHVKYIIDRKKFFIQIESILIKDNNDLYIITISGKKRHMDILFKTINNIFSTIKINEQ